MFNQTTIMGFLGNDPSIHTFQHGNGAGSKSATFTVAVNKSYTDRQGHKQTITTWFNCVAYNKMADIVAQITKKGSLVFVQGELQQNKPYTNKDGVMVQSYSLVVDTIRLLGGSGSIAVASHANNNQAHSSVAGNHDATADAINNASFNTQQQVVDNEDSDIPF